TGRSSSSTRTTPCGSRGSSRTPRCELDELLLLLRVALSLATVLGLLWYLQRRLARRGKQRRDDDGIVVIARQPLGSKSQLVIVEADDRRYVLGVGEHGISVIDSLPAGHVSRPVRHLASERAEAQSA